MMPRYPRLSPDHIGHAARINYDCRCGFNTDGPYYEVRCDCGAFRGHLTALECEQLFALKVTA